MCSTFFYILLFSISAKSAARFSVDHSHPRHAGAVVDCSQAQATRSACSACAPQRQQQLSRRPAIDTAGRASETRTDA
eukprot:2465026-Prymnesium_polylepis.1